MITDKKNEKEVSQDSDSIDVSSIADGELSNSDFVTGIYNRIKYLSNISNLNPAQLDELDKLTTLWFTKIHLKDNDSINKPFKTKHKEQEEIVSSFIAKNSTESIKNDFDELKKKLERILGRKIKTSKDYKGFFGKIKKAWDDFKDKLKDIKKFFKTWKGKLVIAGSVVGIGLIIYLIFFL